MKTSSASQISDSRIAVGVAAALCIVVSAFAWWANLRGYLLYYGDAQSHLNLSRSIIDSRTPGYDQIGTVWLPVLHLLCLPLVRYSGLWSSGLAGTVPVAACFVVAGTLLFLSARLVYSSSVAACVACACFALNPNILYLSVTPMTEMVFVAGLATFLYAALRFRRSPHWGWMSLAVVASWWMCLTRYDGWFLVPFEALAFALCARRSRTVMFLAFAALASLAPIYWMAHSWWETGNPLDFYNGPYSAQAIQHGQPYPGFGDWPKALLYYRTAGQLCAGLPLLLIGFAGLCVALARKQRSAAAIGFLLLTPAFYVWSIHSSGNPIHVPPLYPFTYYNTRYGIALAVAAAFAAGSLVQGSRRVAFVLSLIAIAPWLLHPGPEHWITWKESQVNSAGRRAWTRAGAQFFQAHYQGGEGILAYSGTGDVAAIFSPAQIPLREVLHIGNGPAWLATTRRPDVVHRELWALAQEGDPLDWLLSTASQSPYKLTELIQVRDAPALKIWRREP